jgi:hypothetical protein
LALKKVDIMLRILGFFAAILLLAPASVAQPFGPYQRACEDVSIDRAQFAGKSREYLYAVCGDRSGRPIANMFYNFRRCRGQIQSVDGVLRCDGVPVASLPRGTYLRTCENLVFAHGVAGYETLYAQCQTRRGRLTDQSEIQVSECGPNGITNENGELACAVASGPYPGPGPGYRDGPGPYPGPGPGYRDGPEPPRGSYRSTCGQAYVAQGPGRSLTLYAQCETRRGRVVDAVLPDYQACRGDIGNNDGRLVCQAVQRENLGEAPRGSYRSTCRDERLVRGPGGTIDLIASCQTRIGRLVDATLPNVRGCNGDIGNDDGRLVCQAVQRENLGEAPRGSYRSTCRDERLVRGPGGTIDLIASCQTRTGRLVDATLPNVRGCNGDIGNDDGRLICGQTSAPPPFVPPPVQRERPPRQPDVQQPDPQAGTPPPPGSYLGSCSKATVDGANTLRALCKNNSGEAGATTLPNVAECKGDIGNNNGQLVCAR